MVSYFAGGPLADRFSARRLMTTALGATGAGGLVLTTVPAPAALTALWAFWGLTTVLLFWAALIRATREWGGSSAQGRAYGLLDGGRGLFAALIASVSVVVFSWALPGEAASATSEEQASAFRVVIQVFTACTLLIAILVWTVVPDEGPGTGGDARTGLTLDGIKSACGMPVVWLQAIVVVCAYVGYKATDDFSLLARDALGIDEVAAAGIGTLSFWLRAISAIGAGFIGDRLDPSRVIAWGFGILAAGSLAISSEIVPLGTAWILISTIVATSVGVYALRGLYFALLAEGSVPMAYTGAAIGVISFVGYTPDVFMGPLMGVLLDGSPGVPGHRHVFMVVAAFAVVGLLAAVTFRRVAAKNRGEVAPPGSVRPPPRQSPT
jgi:sugar phosphate permease